MLTKAQLRQNKDKIVIKVFFLLQKLTICHFSFQKF